MICKSCGQILEKNWKYCPKCSKKTNNKFKIILIILSLVILLIFLLTVINSNLPLNEKSLKKHLQEEYNEEFTNITLVSSVSNPDTNLTCDDASFGTIKGKGTTEYYKIYSKKNNIEFFAWYDTSDKKKNIHDNYSEYLTRRDTILKAYDIININLNNNISKISISDNTSDKLIAIDTKLMLTDILSTFEDDYILDSNHVDMYIHVNEDIYEYSKNNYSIINNLNSQFVSLRKSYYFNMAIIFNDNAIIRLARLNNEAYVYDKFANGKAWGEKLDDFIKRDFY